MIEDQKYILEEILKIIDKESPDALLIAGDNYDKSVPTIEAVTLLDEFLMKLCDRKLPTFMISGNHDSAERTAFASKLIEKCEIYISPAYRGVVEPLKLKDEFGEVNIYLLPFVKPANVRAVYPEEQIDSYTDAIRVAIENMKIDTTSRNILVAHQFVTGSIKSDSEEISVGGSDNVDAEVFDVFDYVALGHIHRPQNVVRETIRYSGSPLKYSFSEAKYDKSVTVVELEEKFKINVRTVALVPKREMVEISGTYEELTSREFYINTTYQDDYIHITLKDEDDIPDAISKLRTIYKNIMKLDYDNIRTRMSNQVVIFIF